MSKRNKILSLLDFLANPARDIEIFGMFGPGNLGDEAMLVAAKNSLPTGRGIPWQNYPSRPWLNTLVRKRPRKHLLVGGGTLIHGGNSGWLDYVEMRSLQGVKVSFFGTGISFTLEEISSGSSHYQRWCEVIARSEEVHLRGPHSVAVSRAMGCDADVFGDFAFLLYSDDMPVRNHERRENIVGINVGQCLADQEKYEKASAKIVRQLATNHRLIFHVVVASDFDATQRVIASADLPEGSYKIETHYFDPYLFMESIRNYRAFIGLKLHAAGLAQVAGVPCLMIPYLPKCLDFMAPLSGSEHMLVNLPLDADFLLSKVQDVIENPQKYVLDKRIAAIASIQKETLNRVFLENCP